MREELEAYLSQGTAEGWTPKTLKSYRQRLEMLGAFLQWPRVTEIKYADLLRFIQHLRGKGVKPTTYRSTVFTVRRFFSRLSEQGRILSNPARAIEVERRGEPELPEPPLSMAEAAALLDGMPRRHAIDLRNRALLEVLYGCGLRLNEALSLDLKDIDLQSRVLHVRHGKGNKERLLPIGRGALAALKDYLALRRSMLRGPDQGALFLCARNGRWQQKAATYLFSVLGKSSALKGKRLHAHLLRHSAAVHMLQNGADIRHIREFLGHESLDSTKIYLRLVPGRLKEDYEKAFPEIAVTA